MNKTCTKCNIEKPTEEFDKDMSRKDQTHCWCKKCRKDDHIKNREQYNKYRRNYYHNPINFDRIMSWNLRSKYGITLSEKNVLIEKQGGKCAICGDDLVDGHRTHIDHDHKTGLVRGILCGLCNPVLGYIRENPVIAHNMAEYLIKWRNKNV